MPIIKRSLTRAEMASHLARANQLRAMGVDIEMPEEWQQNSCPIGVVVGGVPASVVFEVPSGLVGYVVWLRLVARSRVTLIDCRLTAHWDDAITLETFDERSPICRFSGLEYPRSEVLNARLENSLRFHYRGQMVEDMILASGLKRIPDSYRTGMIAPLQITFIDSLEHETSVEANLYVDRTAKRKNTALRPRSSGLYAPLENPAASERICEINSMDFQPKRDGTEWPREAPEHGRLRGQLDYTGQTPKYG